MLVLENEIKKTLYFHAKNAYPEECCGILLGKREGDKRYLMLRDIGVKGQKPIKAAKVLIIGLGSLGSPVVQYLAAAGVGTIGIADFDEQWQKKNKQSRH